MTPLQKLLGLTIFGLVLQRGLSINVPVGEELESDQVAAESHQQQHFQPSSKGNSRYQIYEIHNHYVLPSSSHRHNQHQSYARSPLKQEIRIKHVNAPPPPPPPPHPAQHAHDQEDIHVSFLSFAAAEGPNGQQITVTEPVPRSQQHQVGAKYLPPIRQNVDYVPNYRSQIPERQHLTTHHQHQAQQVSSPQYFDNTAAQYVAAAHHGAVQHAYKGPDYLPPLPSQNVQQVNLLPPLQSQAVRTEQSAEQSHAQYNAYNGCGEHNCQSYSQQAVALTAPQDAGAVTQQNNPQQYQSFAVSAHYQVSDSLSAHAEASGPTIYSAAGYLPPQHNPETRHTSDQTLQPQYVQHNPPQLPQSHPQQQNQQQQHHQQVFSPNIFTALPPGYEFEKPANVEQAFAELHSQQIEQQKQAALAHQQQERASYSSYLQQQQLVNHAISHQQPQQQQIQQQQQQQIQQQQPQIQQQQQQQPQQQHIQQQSQQQEIQQQQQIAQYVQPAPYNAPVYLPPVAVAAAPQQNYHQEPQMYSLNSYMTSVQPYDRYGYSSFSNTAAPRKPFAQYGTPDIQHTLQVAPMYSESATLPVAYASAMPYKTNEAPPNYTTFTLSGSQQSQKQPPLRINEQTLQSLQTLMPKDIKEQQVATGGIGKLRTVQILNSNLLKTLKVLETHDSAGVKTIKILGDSNESPIGAHQIVRVVSPSKADAHQENVQTVKIFNDHKDVQLAGGSTAANAATVSNRAYLPPVSKVEKKRAVRDSREAHALPQQFGRQT